MSECSDLVETRHCAAPGCGAELVRKQGEPRHQFEQRATCGQHCAGILREFNRQTPERRAALSAERHCQAPGCGATLVRREGERADNFLRRRSCSKQCSARMRGASSRSEHVQAAVSAKRHCAAPGCGKLLVQRENERTDIFARRITCGLSCGAKLQTISPERRAQMKLAHARDPNLPKPCKFCGELFGRKRNQALSGYALQHYCSDQHRIWAKQGLTVADVDRLSISELGDSVSLWQRRMMRGAWR